MLVSVKSILTYYETLKIRFTYLNGFMTSINLRSLKISLSVNALIAFKAFCIKWRVGDVRPHATFFSAINLFQRNNFNGESLPTVALLIRWIILLHYESQKSIKEEELKLNLILV